MTRNDAYISALAYGQGTYVQPAFNGVVIPAFSYAHTYIVAAIVFDGILFPSYAGQKLGADAVLEIWALDSYSPCVADEDIELTVGPLTFQAAGRIATCGQIEGTTTTLTATVI